MNIGRPQIARGSDPNHKPMKTGCIHVWILARHLNSELSVKRRSNSRVNGKTKRRSPQVTLFNNKLGLSRAFETLQPVNPISKHQKFRMQRRTQNLKVKARYNSISSVDFFQCVFCLISIKKFKKYEIRFM